MKLFLNRSVLNGWLWKRRFLLRLIWQLFAGGRRSYSLWLVSLIISWNSLSVSCCLRTTKGTNSAEERASSYDNVGKIIRIARCCILSMSVFFQFLQRENSPLHSATTRLLRLYSIGKIEIRVCNDPSPVYCFFVV